ncbi:MAG: glycoside hydrolase [Sphingobacteriales bacterium]|nr:glycoside hydrolase [Sphingobacteriales bacterium]
MKYRLLPALALLCISAQAPGQAGQQLKVDFNKLANTHDISLSPWGPYSKKYAGVSHIYDMKAGMRFDFSVLPGFYRNKILIPNVQCESGYFPWEVNNDLTRFTYRYELEWKDKVYTDITYTVIDSATVLVSMKCVNSTDIPQNLSLNLVYGIEYPDVYPASKLVYSEHSTWLSGTDYLSLDYVQKRPKDNLVTDGWIRGEVRDNAFIGGSAVGQDFGKGIGDKLVYQPVFKQEHPSGTLSIWYRMKENSRCTLNLTKLVNQAITLDGNGKLSRIDLPYQLTGKQERSIVIESAGGDAIELNGILLTPSGEESVTRLEEQPRQYSPESVNNAAEQKLISKYSDIPLYYGFGWDGNLDFKLRQIKNDELDIFFRRLVHSHVDSILKGNYKGDYSNIFIRPVELEPRAEKTIYGLLCTGNEQQVKNRLNELAALSQQYGKEEKTGAQSSANILPQGEKYLFSQKMLKATVLNDVVYPIYTQREYIRHFTPGKWWNSLYTWDLGFIALGLNEINIDKAAECINAYTTPVGSQSAFIHHGSPVPTQFYAFLDLWNRTQSREMLAYFYPRLKQYYEFMSGRLGSSSTRTLKSNLLKTWDYWYNSGGWDDYPPQVEVHRQKAEASIAPVINTAQQIRIGKIMRMAAQVLGLKADIPVYDKDIKDFSLALQKYSWNPRSGYFSYVLHDKDGHATGRLNYGDSTDYNMGLDGAYPLIAGICTPDQQNGLIEKIFSENHMWSPAGISVVDQSAPYYRIDGYWNGSVWMPHQWFTWKTMLDLGRPELAFKIAEKALDVYSKETNESYYTFEHFLAKSGRGAGWHQFSGLSNPVLSWFGAYYRKGTVTTGFETWINQQSFNKDLSSYKADIVFDQATTAHQRSILICLNPAFTYTVTFNGKKVNSESPYPGLLQIKLPASNTGGKLEVVKTGD